MSPFDFSFIVRLISRYAALPVWLSLLAMVTIAYASSYNTFGRMPLSVQ